MENFKIPPGNRIAFDTETTGLYPNLGDLPYSFGFCNEQGDTSVVSFPVDPYTRHVLYSANMDACETLREFFLNPEIEKLAHNAAFDTRMTEAALGVKIQGKIICTMSMIRLCKSSSPLALKPFCSQHLGIPDQDEKDLKEATRKARAEGKKKGWKIFRGKNEEGSLAPDYWLAGKEFYEPYNIMDAVRAMAVYQALRPDIEKNSDLKKIWKNEQLVWKINRKIEQRGIKVDRNKVLHIQSESKKNAQEFLNQAHKIAGKKINLNSPKQLREIFYQKFKLPIIYTTKTGLPSTDTTSLESMKHPLAELIIKIRAATKCSEFMEQYVKFMVYTKGYWTIHPQISESIPTTGRESMRDPNLQQAPEEIGFPIMSAREPFVPRKEYEMRSYDWKNIEVYIPAFASGEKNLTKVLLKNGDVHQQTADKLGLERYTAKTVWFGLQYGIGIKKLAKSLNIDQDQAEQIILKHKEEYPSLWDWFEKIKNQGLYKGRIVTPFGRIQEIQRDYAYRAINYYVQSTAADIMKFSKVRVCNALKGRKSHMLLSIHDEFLVQIHKKEDINEIDKLVVAAMQDNPELTYMPIPIPVSISRIKNNWAEKEKIS